MPTARKILTLRPGDDVLQRFANGLGALGADGTRKVLARSLNRAGGPALTAVRRELARATSAPMSLIRKQVYARKAWAGSAAGEGRLDFQIISYGKPIPLAFFKPREFSYGVRAKVWGRWQRFDGMFMRGGRWPDRVELDMGGKVFVRTSKARLPIEQAFGPSLPHELFEPPVLKIFAERATKLGDAIAHELDRELTRLG
jgi:hypothetical protein